MFETLKTTEDIRNAAGTFRARIVHDEHADNPRHNDYAGAIEITERQGHYLSTDDPFVSGTVHDAVSRRFTRREEAPISMRALMRYLRIALDAHTVLPIYSGTDGPSAGDPDQAGGTYGNEVIGVTFMPNETAREELTYSPTWDVAGCLRMELDLYNKWARGEYVGWIIEKFIPACEHGHGDEWVHVDSVWGIDDAEYAETDAREVIEHHGKQAQR